MDDIDKIKEANRIEDVIEESGFKLQRRRGKYLRAAEHDSLVINTTNQTYSWNSQNEIQGDVIEWLMQRNGWDFRTAIEHLCKRAHLPEPAWRAEDTAARVVRRKRESVFALAQAAMQKWLFADEEALNYCYSRGWTGETIREAGLGFSGRRAAATYADIAGDLRLHEIDVDCAEAVAIMGYKGDVAAWGKKWGIEPQENWLQWNLIPGLMGQTRLVYAHYLNGRVETFSARNILGAEFNKEGKEIKSYNLASVLVGERRPYFNHAYKPRAEECVIVEGQADAVTLGQWGIAAVAMVGTAHQDHEKLIEELRKRYERLYLGLDADEAGIKALIGRNNDWPMAFLMGPAARVVRWPESVGPYGDIGKDANDWLRWGMAKEGLTEYRKAGESGKEKADDIDPLLKKAVDLTNKRAMGQGEMSIAELQRVLKIGYPRAANLMEELRKLGVINGGIVRSGSSTSSSKDGLAMAEDMDAPSMSGTATTDELVELTDEELRGLAEGRISEAIAAVDPVDEGLAVDEKQGTMPAATTEMEEGGAGGDLTPTTTAGLSTLKGKGKLIEKQARMAHELLNRSLTFAEEVATWAGAMRGAKKDAAYRTAFDLFAYMNPFELTMYRTKLSAIMGVGLREFDGVLKGTKKEQNGDKQLEVVETLGGFIHGWLVEFLYDPKSEKEWGRLAYRDPEGKIGSAEYLDIEGVRYVPRRITNFVRNGGILFPSDIGAMKSTRELVTIVEMFLQQNYLLENVYLGKIIAYYVLLTWVYDSFNALSYLRAMGEPGAGKSELMRRVGYICYRLMVASGANTTASLFRATEMYRGTVFIDEADLYDGGEPSNDMVKFLNQGAMRGNPIWRLEEMTTANGREYEVATFDVFCPKLIAMRRDFKDDAVGSRCLTLKLMPREPVELKSRGIRLYIDEEFREKARHIRNLLLRWRLQMWQPEIEVSEELMDLDISSRLNQVTMPLKALAADDPSLQEEIVKFLRQYNQEMVLTKSMTLGARVVEAMWKIYTDVDYREKYLIVGTEGSDELLMIGDVAKVANEIIDEMNELGTEQEEESEDTKKKRKRDSLTARGVGSIIRNELQLQVGERRGKGFPVYWDQIKMEALGKRYGVMTEDGLRLTDIKTPTLSSADRGTSSLKEEAKQEKLEFSDH